MSSWVWTHSTVEIWKRYIKGKFGYDVEQPVRMQKHKLIAQAFAKRKAFQEEGRLSISFRNTHTDPVGLNFNIDSAASRDFSSAWANNLARFVNRRCALTGAVTSSSHEPRRNSVDSVSVSVRHVSVESRRNSVESHTSVKYAEMKATKVASRGRSRKPKRYRRQEYDEGDREQKLMEFVTNRESEKKLRKFTSKEYKNRKRRSASAGLNTQPISSFLLSDQKRVTTDEENDSVASVLVKEAYMDIRNISFFRNIGKGDVSDEDSHDFTIHDSSINTKDYNTTDDEKMKHVSCNTNTQENPESSNDDMDVKDERIRKSRRRHRNKRDEEKNEEKSMDFARDSLSSLDSEPPIVHSSYSGGTSRNSKKSCDVGIQADESDITKQWSLVESKSDGAENVNRRWQAEKDAGLNKTEQLKQLLLPSK